MRRDLKAACLAVAGLVTTWTCGGAPQATATPMATFDITYELNTSSTFPGDPLQNHSTTPYNAPYFVTSDGTTTYVHALAAMVGTPGTIGDHYYDHETFTISGHSASEFGTWALVFANLAPYQQGPAILPTVAQRSDGGSTGWNNGFTDGALASAALNGDQASLSSWYSQNATAGSLRFNTYEQLGAYGLEVPITDSEHGYVIVNNGVSGVPEPASLSLVLGAVALLALKRRDR